MSRQRFTIESDFLELLLAFEGSQGLSDLAATMCKDASVVSRNLLRLAELAPVLRKSHGKWQITEVGQELNKVTSDYLAKIELILKQRDELSSQKVLLEPAALIIVNAQKVYESAEARTRTNLNAEKNIAELISAWRVAKKPIVFAQHASSNPASPFFPEKASFDFIDSLRPFPSELVVIKNSTSAFTGTELKSHLTAAAVKSVVVVGFTAAECIDATAKEARTLGFAPSVVTDAVVSFELRNHQGQIISAARVEEVTFANLHAGFAQLIETQEVLKTISKS